MSMLCMFFCLIKKIETKKKETQLLFIYLPISKARGKPDYIKEPVIILLTKQSQQATLLQHLPLPVAELTPTPHTR